MSFKIGLFGRTNVGKSTLFNRLADNSDAITHGTPGVTRDLKYSTAHLGNIKFNLIDTPGLEQKASNPYSFEMNSRTFAASEEADIMLFIVDLKVGLTEEDKFYANNLRKYNKPVYILANKGESSKFLDNYYDFYGLGMGEPVIISAEHGDGLGDLYQLITEAAKLKSLQEAESETEKSDNKYKKTNRDKLPQSQNQNDQELTQEEMLTEEEDVPSEEAIKLIISGRPNSGKSTLINSLLGKTRVLTSDKAGTTREAISEEFNYHGTKFQLVDTAGLRKKSAIDDSLEKLSAKSSIEAIRYGHVVILLVDATHPLEKQDLTIAGRAAEEGRPLVLGVNKWDLVEDKDATSADIKFTLENSFTDVSGINVVYMSALHGQRLDNLMKAAIRVYNNWNTQITTSKLNEWLQVATANNPPPLAKNGKAIKLKFIKQTTTRPPKFKCFVNKSEELPSNYRKYLKNHLRDYFNLPGTVLRFKFVKPKNPYIKK